MAGTPQYACGEVLGRMQRSCHFERGCKPSKAIAKDCGRQRDLVWSFEQVDAARTRAGRSTSHFFGADRVLCRHRTTRLGGGKSWLAVRSSWSLVAYPDEYCGHGMMSNNVRQERLL